MREWLRKMRKNQNFSQSDIAELAGVDVTTISKIELGERRPSVEVAKKIAEVLGFDWTLFFTIEKDEEQKARDETSA